MTEGKAIFAGKISLSGINRDSEIQDLYGLYLLEILEYLGQNPS